MPQELRIEVDPPQVITRDAVREPALFRLASGDMLLSYHVQSDVYFALRQSMRLTRGETTWQPQPQRTHREQAIGQAQSSDANGLVLTFDIYTFERKPGEYVGSYYQSDDGGKTFTGPHETVLYMDRVLALPYPTEEHFPEKDHPLFSFFQPLPAYYERICASTSRNRGPTFWRYLIEQDGRWLATVHCRWHGDRQMRTVLIESNDAGKTWQYASTIATEQDGSDRGFCEPVLARLDADSLLCIMRRGGRVPLGQCRSMDEGKTWSPVELLEGHGVDPDLCLMSNGILACTYGRPGRHIMFSLDGRGETWSHHTPLGDWPGSCYVSVAQMAPNKLLVVHDHSDGTHDPDASHIGSQVVHVTTA